MWRIRKAGFWLVLVFLCAAVFPPELSAEECPGCSVCEVVRPDLFFSSERIVIVPFSPGPRVFADGRTDQASLSIVQGMAEEFERDGRLSVAGNESADQADLIVTGQIDELRQEKSWKRFLLKKPRQVLGVHGRILYHPDSTVVAVFSFEVNALSGDGTDIRALGVELGGKLVRCVLTLSKQNIKEGKGEVQ